MHEQVSNQKRKSAALFWLALLTLGAVLAAPVPVAQAMTIAGSSSGPKNVTPSGTAFYKGEFLSEDGSAVLNLWIKHSGAADGGRARGGHPHDGVDSKWADNTDFDDWLALFLSDVLGPHLDFGDPNYSLDDTGSIEGLHPIDVQVVRALAVDPNVMVIARITRIGNTSPGPGSIAPADILGFEGGASTYPAGVALSNEEYTGFADAVAITEPPTIFLITLGLAMVGIVAWLRRRERPRRRRRKAKSGLANMSYTPRPAPMPRGTASKS